MIKHNVKASVLFLFLLLSTLSFAQYPAKEVRAVWLTTNWGLDWPVRGTSVESQKTQLRKILDQLQVEHINTVLFQAREQGRVFYRSSIEPLSPFFNHDNNFDPLAFAIDECHKRGMECHAWLITYPMGKAQHKTVRRGRKKTQVVVDQTPPAQNYKLMEGTWYLDPGDPRTTEHLLSMVKEIVSNYDVDGIHFDYIRYPSNTRQFPDDDTYRKYGSGMNKEDWRRNNINQFVFAAYDTVKSIKKWVQVSSSPLGRYRVLRDIAPNDGWTAYETVFQDAGYWLQQGKHDLVFPMMYYRKHLFNPFLDDWSKNANGRSVVPGIGVYQMMGSEQDWPLDDISDQVSYSRQTGVQGQAYFRAGNLLGNLKGVKDMLGSYYLFPAKLPSLSWLDNEAPNSPLNLELYKDKEGNLHLKWDAPDSTEDFTYTVYVSKVDDIDVNNASEILATGLRSNNFSFAYSNGEFGMYYSVTASDRYHNESVPCVSAFFSHASNEQ